MVFFYDSIHKVEVLSPKKGGLIIFAYIYLRTFTNKMLMIPSQRKFEYIIDKST